MSNAQDEIADNRARSQTDTAITLARLKYSDPTSQAAPILPYKTGNGIVAFGKLRMLYIFKGRQQKWKSAFKNPSGKLALKVGVPESKNRYVQNFKGHTDGVWHVCTAKIGSFNVLASASADQTAKIWMVENGSQPLVNYSAHNGSVNSVAIRSEGARNTYSECHVYSQPTFLTCSGDRSSHIWRVNFDKISEIHQNENESQNDELPSLQQLHQPLIKLTGHSDVVIDGDWLFGGDEIITVSWDRTANLFAAETGKILRTLSGHDRELTRCSVHPSQKLLATASRDFTFRLWDFREPIHSVAVFQGHNEFAIYYNLITRTAYAILSNFYLQLSNVWDLRNMRSPISAIRLNIAVNRISICNAKSLLAIPLDNRNIYIYDMNGSRMTRIPRNSGKCHHRLVSACTWLSDNPLNNLITCGFDKQIIGWRVYLPSSNFSKF
uniref:WD repeat-containing protein 37 n=1 Tax=Meloidogyne hapla TaxID=6305 RepID=A0A1I8B0P6_MELHA